MKPYVWKEGMSEKEMCDGAYWERNLLALFLANLINSVEEDIEEDMSCGWYEHGEWEGWSRVISIFDGGITFHVPDDFDLGDLRQIEPNWNNHTTEEKWTKIMEVCGCKIEEDQDEDC